MDLRLDDWQFVEARGSSCWMRSIPNKFGHKPAHILRIMCFLMIVEIVANQMRWYGASSETGR
jgi:hypothetical protein